MTVGRAAAMNTPYRDITNKKIIVVGGSGGIGRACLRLFASYGGIVSFTSRNSINPKTPREQRPPRPNKKIRRWKLDLKSDNSISAFVNQISRQFCPIDVLVLCQGVIQGKSLEAYSLLEMDNVFAINVIGAIKLVKLLKPYMAVGSSIVFLTSISAFAGSYDPVYASSKGAILPLVKSLSKQFGPTIRVNAVAPGLTKKTGMYSNMDGALVGQHTQATITKRLATPEDIANTVVFLSCSASQHIVGACIDVNGGEYLR